jgi:asparagine synthase (glutamine-hydrolysing)
MRFSVESRVPFLDRALTEFAFRLPERFFVTDDGTTKNLLRSAMRGVVPDAILDRRDKIGFATPEAEWLRERSADELVSANIGFLDAAAARQWHTMSEAELGLGAGGQWRLLNLARWVRVFGIDAR